MISKNYNIKVYTMAGDYVSTFSPAVVMEGVSFSGQIGGGQGEMRCKLNLPFASVAVAQNNVIKVYEADDASPSGRIIYTGIVGSLLRINDSGLEYVEVRALGLASLLSYLYYTSTGLYAFNKNQDANATVKDVIDSIASAYPGLITYTGTSTEDVGAVSNIAFDHDKALEAITKTVGTTSYWWSIYGDGVLHFHPKTGALGQITHKVTIGKDVDSIEVEENSEKVVNSYLLYYSGGSTSASDVPSQTANGFREFHESDTQINDLTTANAKAAAYIAQNKDPLKITTVVINSRYDIESIRPGDLLTVQNSDYSISSLQIVRVEYNPDQIKVELEEIVSFAKEVLS